MEGGGPLGEDIPGERRIASYRDDEMRLTDQRVVYRGRGLARHERVSVRLDDIKSVGIRRRFMFVPALAAVPVVLFLLGLTFAFMVEDEGPLVLGTMLAVVTLPLPWLRHPLTISITTPGGSLHVRVRGRAAEEALTFIHRIEVTRAELRAAAPSQRAAPTAVSFA